MAAQALEEMTLAELAPRIASRVLSPVELADALLARTERLGGRLEAFITRLDDSVRTAAKAAEAEIASGTYRGPLHGVPFGAKDLFWTAGVETTSGSVVDAEFVPGEDAGVVTRLKEAGAIVGGKLNMTEFAFDPSGENVHHGTVHNPWAQDRLTGGSSSGSGAVVAAGLMPLALGTDTGGSVRIPASLCGITGLKPTFGLVSRHGVTPLSWSMDHVGPMARSAEDAAIALNVLAGYDPRDTHSARTEARDYTMRLNDGIRGLRIGVPRELVWDAVDPEVEVGVKAAIAELEAQGASVIEVSIPEFDYAPAVFSATIAGEAASVHRERVLANGDRFEPVVRLRIESGMFVSAAAYLQAQRVRALIVRRFAEVMERVDLLALPATAIAAPLPGQRRLSIKGTERPTLDLLLRLSRPFNLVGAPAISLPCGFNADGLPLGLQLVGRPFEDALVLRAAHAYQQATTWHLQRPPL